MNSVSVPDSARPLVGKAMSHQWRMTINGEMREAQDGATYQSVNPATEEIIASAPAASAADVNRAVSTATEAFAAWRELDVRARSDYVRRLAALVAEHEEELGLLDSLDGGNPITAMRNDVAMAVEVMNIYASWALELGGATIPATSQHLHYTVREPYGVVGRITPYNHPILFAAGRVAAPLIAGNAVVLKAPDQTPFSSLRFGELASEVLPPGVLSVITGSGSEAGDALVRHPDVRRIAFIGSVPTGRAIQRAAAESGVKHVTLELGGKNPMLVFPDADLDRAVHGAVLGMNFHWTGGQSCSSTSRLFVHESVYDEFVPRVVEAVEKVRLGSPLDPTVEMGCMVSKTQYDKVMGYIDLGLEQGAELLTGGGRPEGAEFGRGYWVAPTVFAGVRPDMRLFREEIFGPVLSVVRWNEEAELLAMANDVSYGLTASIWTESLRTAHRVARKVESGYVWINGSSRHFWGTPFGGFKDSGVGREEGIEEILDFTQTKTINVMLD